MAPRFKYTDQQMQDAIYAVKNGMKVVDAALKYEVPKSTLADKVSGRTPLKRKMGSATILTDEEEQKLVDWIQKGNRRGLPPHKKDIMDLVQNMIQADPTRITPFKDGRPGKNWWKGFMARHKELPIRTPERVSRARSCITEASIPSWFAKFEENVQNLLHSDAMEDPHCIFNMDEGNIQFSPKTGCKISFKETENDIYEPEVGFPDDINDLENRLSDGIYEPEVECPDETKDGLICPSPTDQKDETEWVTYEEITIEESKENIQNELNIFHHDLSENEEDEELQKKLERTEVLEITQDILQHEKINMDHEIKKSSIHKENELNDVIQEEYLLMGENQTPVMVSEGTQCDLFDENEEENINLFCCTFRNNNEVETFCYLNSEAPFIQKPFHLDKNPKAKKSRTKKKPEIPYINKDIKLNKNEETLLILTDKPDEKNYQINDEGIIINIAEQGILCETDAIFKDIDIANVQPKMSTDIELKNTSRGVKRRTTDKLDINIKKRFRKRLKLKSTLSDDYCKLCENVKDKSLCGRIAIHVDDKFSCKYCNKIFDDLVTLKIHTKELHPGMFQPFKCEFCDKNFSCKLLKSRHTKTFTCRVCNIFFNCRSAFESHRLKSHSTDIPFKCELCPMTFKSKGKLFNHNKAIKCSLCDVIFSCKTYMRRHKRDGHTHLNTCPICNKVCKTTQTYQVHMLTHENTKTYICEICAKEFSSTFLLNNHRRIHTGESPYLCETCGASFSNSGALYSHVRSVHPKNSHKNTSSPLHKMGRHAQSVMRVKSFICEICQKEFSTKQFLENHQRIHTGERPYLCDTCGASFNHSGSLYTHKHSVHGVIKNVINEDGTIEAHLVKKKHKIVSKSDPNVNPQSKAKKPKITIHVVEKIM